MSFNNKDAGRVVNNKYSKGIKKYKTFSHVKSKKQDSKEEKKDEEWEDVEWENDEWKNDESKFNYKNISYQQKQNTLMSNWKTTLDDIYNIMIEN